MGMWVGANYLFAFEFSPFHRWDCASLFSTAL